MLTLLFLHLICLHSFLIYFFRVFVSCVKSALLWCWASLTPRMLSVLHIGWVYVINYIISRRENENEERREIEVRPHASPTPLRAPVLLLFGAAFYILWMARYAFNESKRVVNGGRADENELARPWRGAKFGIYVQSWISCRRSEEVERLSRVILRKDRFRVVVGHFGRCADVLANCNSGLLRSWDANLQYVRALNISQSGYLY